MMKIDAGSSSEQESSHSIPTETGSQQLLLFKEKGLVEELKERVTKVGRACIHCYLIVACGRS
jgi:hypothetical protein